MWKCHMSHNFEDEKSQCKVNAESVIYFVIVEERLKQIEYC